MDKFFPSSILVIASHPDDEVLMAGGTMARNHALGGKNHVIFMTNGVGSREINNSISYVNKRIEEAKKANEILASVLLSTHNIFYYQELMSCIRLAINEKKISQFVTTFYDQRNSGDIDPV